MAASKCSIILAGGSGTRFWPLSRAGQPKQYLTLFGDRSLIQHTWDRVLTLTDPTDTYICSAASHVSRIKQQLPNAGLMLEPEPRNTGPAVLFAMLSLLAKGYSRDAVVGVFPADHFITATEGFTLILEEAFAVATASKGLVTLGIVPTSPHTGYGYIEKGPAFDRGAFRVARFVEKPSAATAVSFLGTGRFFWNSGIFVWTLGAILNAYETHAPEAFRLAKETKDWDAVYPSLPREPVDKMILEKAEDVFVVPANMGWSDVGSWNALYALKAESPASNVVEAQASAVLSSTSCLVHAPGKTVSVIGLDNVIVVADGDAILVCSRSNDQQVREAANLLDTPS